MLNKNKPDFNRILEWSFACGMDIKLYTDLGEIPYSPNYYDKIRTKTPRVDFSYHNRSRSYMANDWQGLIDQVIYGHKELFSDLCMPEMPEDKANES